MDMSEGPAKELASEFIGKAVQLKATVISHLNDVMRNRRDLTHAELCVALREIYWARPEIPEEWLRDAFLIFDDREFYDSFQNILAGFRCNNCSTETPMMVRDRKDRDRIGSMILVCPDCTAKLNEERDEEDRRKRLDSIQQKMQEEIDRLRALPYQEYLQTEHWRTVREDRLNVDDNRCQLCRETERLQVHHSTYERLGCEEIDDILTLCAACHQNFHDHRQLTRPQ